MIHTKTGYDGERTSDINWIFSNWMANGRLKRACKNGLNECKSNTQTLTSQKEQQIFHKTHFKETPFFIVKIA